jgi:hypothetical protein
MLHAPICSKHNRKPTTESKKLIVKFEDLYRYLLAMGTVRWLPAVRVVASTCRCREALALGRGVFLKVLSRPVLLNPRTRGYIRSRTHSTPHKLGLAHCAAGIWRSGAAGPASSRRPPNRAISVSLRYWPRRAVVARQPHHAVRPVGERWRARDHFRQLRTDSILFMSRPMHCLP